MMQVVIVRTSSKFRLSPHNGSLFFAGLYSSVRSISSLWDLKESVDRCGKRVTCRFQTSSTPPKSTAAILPCLISCLIFPRIYKTLSLKRRDEMLCSFCSIRPRQKHWNVYSCLLGYTLQSRDPFPIFLCNIQQMIRSGCLPIPQNHEFLTSAWLERRSHSHSAADVLLDMKSIGYSPDCGTCNYVIASLCAVNQLSEAMHVLSCIAKAGCIPDTDSYSTVIAAMCGAQRSADAVQMLREMVTNAGLTPRQETVTKVISALRKNKELRTSVGMIEFLENEDHNIGFEVYEHVVESCLTCDEYLLAAKTVMRLTRRDTLHQG